MAKIPSLTDMLQAGVHFGHQTSRWHPKMKSFIFGERSGVHIINLEETQKMLEPALAFVKSVAARGGSVLFVGTKRQAQAIVEREAKDCGMPYVNRRWLGGTLTNYQQIKNSLRRLKSLKDQRDKGELRKFTKFEQLMLSREIDELEEKVGGIQDMDKIPDAVFVVDIRTEKTAVEESSVMGVKVVAMCDSNVNPSNVDYVIPANDDATKSIDLVTRLVAEAVKEGKAEAAKAPKPEAKPVEKAVKKE
jgi:small subunit ribosomal protein S2